MLNDAQARVTAMTWHGGQWSPLYSFGSSGAIPDDNSEMLREIDVAKSVQAATDNSRRSLEALVDYVRLAGPRGPQPGWANLWDSDFEKAM